MELPRPWIPLDQEDELDEWTEEKIEQHIQTVNAQIVQTAALLKTDTQRIATDMTEEEYAAHVDTALSAAGPDADPGVIQQMNQNRRKLDEITVSDWHKGAEAAGRLALLHDEKNFGQAWLSASEYLRDLRHAAAEHLANAIMQITTTTAQMPFLPQSVVILALPSGEERVDMHYAREQTLQLGELLTGEKTELTVRLHGDAKEPKGDSNATLKATFKIAQFAYYASVLAHGAGDLLKQVLLQFHHVFEHFLPMLSAVATSIGAAIL